MLGTGAGALAFTSSSFASASSNARSMTRARVGGARQQTLLLPFDEVWPQDLTLRPRCGYNWAARLIFTLAKEWKLDPQYDADHRQKTTQFVRRRIDEATFIVPPDADPNELQPATTEAGKFFREMWSGQHKDKTKYPAGREVGFLPTAYNWAEFGGCSTDPSWLLVCTPVVDPGADDAPAGGAGKGEEPAQTSNMHAKQVPAAQTQPATTKGIRHIPKPKAEEVHEILDELP